MWRITGACVLALGAAPLFAFEGQLHGIPDAWRCGRADYSDACRYRNHHRGAVVVVAGVRDLKPEAPCQLVRAYGQSWCDDRSRDVPEEVPKAETKEGEPK